MTNFRTWERDVNVVMINTWGVTADDIPDMPWYDWYKDELTPKEAAEEAMEKFNDPVYGGW